MRRHDESVRCASGKSPDIRAERASTQVQNPSRPCVVWDYWSQQSYSAAGAAYAASVTEWGLLLPFLHGSNSSQESTRRFSSGIGVEVINEIRPIRHRMLNGAPHCSALSVLPYTAGIVTCLKVSSGVRCVMIVCVDRQEDTRGYLRRLIPRCSTRPIKNPLDARSLQVLR